ncbi:MAG: hypothetical protein ACOYY3_06415 [Chloroflexota bacterium]
MMAKVIRDMQVQYITNETGQKTGVILPLDEFEELLEDIQDITALIERRDEPTVPFEEVIDKLGLRL